MWPDDYHAHWTNCFESEITAGSGILITGLNQKLNPKNNAHTWTSFAKRRFAIFYSNPFISFLCLVLKHIKKCLYFGISGTIRTRKFKAELNSMFFSFKIFLLILKPSHFNIKICFVC